MASAKCGMHWSWDSPMWCSGYSDKKEKQKICITCPWYEGNNKDVE